jgi:hypothetical protein
MPPAVLGPALQFGLPAVATLGGALLSSRANNKSTDAQTDATNKAMQFEREREARRRQEYDRYQAERRRQWDAFQAQRAGLLKRWGVPVGPAPRSDVGMSGVERERPRLTLGSLAGRY